MEENKLTQAPHKAFCKIVIVDDSSFIRKQLAETLTDHGFNVVGTAANAQEAMGAVGNNKAHLVLLDVVMPETSGIELIEYLKEHFPHIVVVMISSLSHEHIILEAISAGATDFLHKPVQKETLLAVVEKLAYQITQENS